MHSQAPFPTGLIRDLWIYSKVRLFLVPVSVTAKNLASEVRVPGFTLCIISDNTVFSFGEGERGRWGGVDSSKAAVRMRSRATFLTIIRCYKPACECREKQRKMFYKIATKVWSFSAFLAYAAPLNPREFAGTPKPSHLIWYPPPAYLLGISFLPLEVLLSPLGPCRSQAHSDSTLRLLLW